MLRVKAKTKWWHFQMHPWMNMCEFWLIFHWSLFPRVKLTIFQPGLGYSYSVLVLAILEYWISGTHTLLVLVSFKVIVLVLVLVLVNKYSGTRMSTGMIADILWYIRHLRCKGENHHTCEINSLIYHKGKIPNWFILLWFEYMIHGMWLQIL